MKLIVVGAGGITRELIRRVGEAWDVTVIDIDKSRLQLAFALRDLEAIEGDGSSRIVLERAGLTRADGLIAASNDDNVNLEVCRLAKAANVFNIAAVAADPERLPEYRRLGVNAYSPDRLTSRWLELELEPRRVASSAFAQGRAEAIELRIADDAPVVGQALREIPSADWVVGAVLRDGKLIVPHGDTVIQSGDLVTVIGPAAGFGDIVRTFTSGEARFPLDYGRMVVVVVESEADLEGGFTEAVQITRNSLAQEILVLQPSEDSGGGSGDLVDRARRIGEGLDIIFRAVTGRPQDALAAAARDGNVGIQVIADRGPGHLLSRLRPPAAVRLARATGAPVLVARGTFPYNRILVPARETAAGTAAARAAIDLARSSGAELTGLAVVDPSFISGQAGTGEAERSAAGLKREAAVQQVSVRRRVERGNPVHAFLSHETDLLVLGVDLRSRRPFGVRVVDHLVRRSRSSVLVVPVGD